MRLVIEKNTEGLTALLEKLSGNKLRAAMKNIGEEAVGLVREEFQTSEGPYGEKWAPLKESTLQSFVPGTHRRRESYGTAPLRRRGLLMASFNYQARGDHVEIGTPAAYAVFHQKGGRVLPKRMLLPEPSRGLPKRWQTEIIGSLEEYLDL